MHEFCLAVVIALPGCATTKYAELYVVTPQGSADVYSACDGQYLGLTPLSYIFEKTAITHGPLVFPILIVHDGYKPVHKVAIINKWVSKKQDAVLLENRNGHNVELVSACECLRDGSTQDQGQSHQ